MNFGLETIRDLRNVQSELVSTYEDFRQGNGDRGELAERLGRLVRVYREFHRRTGEMQPDRVIDFSTTCEAIGKEMDTFKEVFLEAVRTTKVALPAGADTIPGMPFLSNLTTDRFAEAPQAYEAATYSHYPRRR